MADEFWDHYFPDRAEHKPADDTETVEPVTLPTREELWEQLHHANQSAKRLAGTIYYDRAHAYIDSILYDLEEIRGR
jgi:hypothetical protein